MLHRRRLLGVVELEVEVELRAATLAIARLRPCRAGRRATRRRRAGASAARQRHRRGRSTSLAVEAVAVVHRSALGGVDRRRSATWASRRTTARSRSPRRAGSRRAVVAGCATRRCSRRARLSARERDRRLPRARRRRRRRSANIGLFGIELAAERHGLLPGLALALRHGIQLGRDRLERRRLVVLRVDLEQLEIDLLPLRILLQRVLQDLLGLRIAAVGEIDLGFGDRIDFVGVDVAETLAAEVAGERILAGVDDAAAGRAEHRVGLDVGAGDDAVLELGRLAPARGDQRRDAARATASAPPPIAQPGVLPKRSSKNPGASFGGALAAASAAAAPWRLRPSAVVTRLRRLDAFGGSRGLRRLGGLRRLDLAAVRAFGGSDLRRLRGLRRLDLRGSGGLAAPARRGRRRRGCGATASARRRRLALASACACSCAIVWLSQLERALQILAPSSRARRCALCASRSGLVARRRLPRRRRAPLPASRRHAELIAARRARPASFLRPSCRSSRRPRARRAFGRRRCAGDAVLVGAPIGGLHAHDLASLRARLRRGRLAALGIVMIAPARRRFMLLPSNALGLLLEERDQHLLERHVSAACTRRRSSTACRRAARCTCRPSPRGAGAAPATGGRGARRAGAGCGAAPARGGAVPARGGVTGRPPARAGMPGGSSRNV